MRQSDYLGTLEDDKLYALLSNTNSRDAEFVLKRFEDAGYTCRIAEEVAI